MGGVSHAITKEHRRIAWGQVNPANTLPDEPEEGKEKEVTLFGGGFWRGQPSALRAGESYRQ